MSIIVRNSNAGSFVQDQAHTTKSEAFVAIQPSQIATVLGDHGFDLVSLKVGRARNPDRVDHQTSIARYRSRQPLEINGLFMDLVFKVPHLYGALQAFVGTYRQICTNGLVVGQKFATGRVRHVGDALSQLDALIPTMVSQHDMLVDHIRLMQSRNVTPTELAQLAQRVAQIRLDGSQNVTNIQYQDILKVRRPEDQTPDLFSVLNVLQENVMRYGIRYQTETADPRGETLPKLVRNMTARPVTRNRQGDTETVRSVDMNASIWDAAMDILSQKEAA